MQLPETNRSGEQTHDYLVVVEIAENMRERVDQNMASRNSPDDDLPRSFATD